MGQGHLGRWGSSTCPTKRRPLRTGLVPPGPFPPFSRALSPIPLWASCQGCPRPTFPIFSSRHAASRAWVCVPPPHSCPQGDDHPGPSPLRHGFRRAPCLRDPIRRQVHTARISFRILCWLCGSASCTWGFLATGFLSRVQGITRSRAWQMGRCPLAHCCTRISAFSRCVCVRSCVGVYVCTCVRYVVPLVPALLSLAARLLPAHLIPVNKAVRVGAYSAPHFKRVGDPVPLRPSEPPRRRCRCHGGPPPRQAGECVAFRRVTINPPWGCLGIGPCALLGCDG